MAKHKVEIFSAGCVCCENAIDMVKNITDDGAEVIILDMRDSAVVDRALALGIRSVPVILIDGKLADCCASRGPDENVIKTALS